jgi:hypothetical protein
MKKEAVIILKIVVKRAFLRLDDRHYSQTEVEKIQSFEDDHDDLKRSENKKCVCKCSKSVPVREEKAFIKSNGSKIVAVEERNLKEKVQRNFEEKFRKKSLQPAPLPLKESPSQQAAKSLSSVETAPPVVVQRKKSPKNPKISSNQKNMTKKSLMSITSYTTDVSAIPNRFSKTQKSEMPFLVCQIEGDSDSSRTWKL